MIALCCFATFTIAFYALGHDVSICVLSQINLAIIMLIKGDIFTSLPAQPSDADIIFSVAVMLIGVVVGYTLGRTRRITEENRGEAAVRRLLTQAFRDERYHLLNNVTLPYLDGTTQIDHVLVARTGVFVIESKHYSGWIFGDSRSPKWTQVIYSKKSRFQNPLRQNSKHVTAVRKLLDFLPPDHVHSIVVFTGNAEFKTPCPSGVIYLGKLVGHISEFTEDVMSQNRMEFCVGRLEARRRLISGRTDVEHIAFLDRKFGRAD